MIYPDDFENKIGFDRIKDLLSVRCLSPMGKEKVNNIRFSNDFEDLSCRLTATSEFQMVLKYEDHFPADHYYEFSGCLNKIRIEGTYPQIHEVFDIKRSLETVKSILAFFSKTDEMKYPVLISLCRPVKIYPFVSESIDRVIDRNGAIKDNASARLKEIKAESAAKRILVSKRLNAILKEVQAEGIVEGEAMVSMRNGRGVIPVNVYSKRRIKGLIHDHSASGKTVFIEPEEIVEINNEIIELEYEEKREIIRILTALADNIRPYIDELLENNLFLGEIDFLRAKALFGNYFNSISPVLVDKASLSWKKAVHPLLSLNFEKFPGRKVVPLDITLQEDERIILISGPNAGGKSVCLKTVGLLQYMVQCGLTIPVEEGSESGIFRSILIDIGDEQSIENDLSTYSSHLINMKYFLRNGDDRTLVLIDEFGTGTEPILGGSIAEAILDELNNMKVFGVITTHYTNLKHFASMTKGIVNGAMAFDNHLLQPLFYLSSGKPGSSFAFEIAKKIGLPEDILNKASVKAGVKNVNFDRHLKDIARDKRYWEIKRQNIRQKEKRLEALIEDYEKELSGVKKIRNEIISTAKEEAKSILKDSNRIIENTIREIKESQADKEKTKAARQQFEDFRTVIREDNPVNAGTEAEKKLEKLRARTTKIKLSRSFNVKDKPQNNEQPLKLGDAVRMIDTMAAGEIVKIEGNMVQVETGMMTFFVPSDKIERITGSELRKNISRSARVLSHNPDPAFELRKLSFKPEIDIRGVRGEEALRQVSDFLDDALIVQYRNLRIIHGKGNGILRKLVREYLATVNIVRTFHDEHVEHGGSGVTVVEMDL